MRDRTPAAGTALNSDDTGERCTVLSTPQDQDRHVIGPSAVRMTISSSTPDADLFLVLRLFTPDLKEVTYSGSNAPHHPSSPGQSLTYISSHRPNPRKGGGEVVGGMGTCMV